MGLIKAVSKIKYYGNFPLEGHAVVYSSDKDDFQTTTLKEFYGSMSEERANAWIECKGYNKPNPDILPSEYNLISEGYNPSKTNEPSKSGILGWLREYFKPSVPTGRFSP